MAHPDLPQFPLTLHSCSMTREKKGVQWYNFSNTPPDTQLLSLVHALTRMITAKFSGVMHNNRLESCFKFLKPFDPEE